MKPLRLSRLVLLSLTAIVAGCVRYEAPSAPPAAPPPPRPDAAALQTELTPLMQKGVATLQSKDPAALASIFTEDATWILPDASVHKGRDEIEKTATAFFKTYESATITSSTVDKVVAISETEALTFSTALYTMTMKGKKPENRRNPFADYWQKGADGVWRVAYEVNSDGAVHDQAAAKP
jgi:uncharacterized protein (TIGR02246 family)